MLAISTENATGSYTYKKKILFLQRKAKDLVGCPPTGG